MKPLHRFFQVGLVKIRSDTGNFAVACDALEVYSCTGGYCLTMYRLYPPGATGADPTIVLKHRIPGSNLIMDDLCTSVAMAIAPGCELPCSRIVVEALPGEFIRPDPYFGVELSGAARELVAHMRDAQHQLTIVERLEEDRNPKLSSMRESLIGLLRTTIGCAEKRMAVVRASMKGEA